MANRRIKDLDERTTLSSGDYIATDNINGTRKVEVTKITNPINQVTQKVSNASDAYSETKAYKVGDIVIQNNTLYVCSTACSAASWAVNQNNFTATTVASELGDLNSALNDYCKVVEATGSCTLEANSQNQFQLSFSVPSGYKAILATPKQAGSWAWCWVNCQLASQSVVIVVIKSMLSVPETNTVKASVLCIRNN